MAERRGVKLLPETRKRTLREAGQLRAAQRYHREYVPDMTVLLEAMKEARKLNLISTEKDRLRA